ncbi:MAG: AAC(3) family N-acetyltransferase [Clostridia bacterium]|nr:AAC(3) family N-acetyltransferase [Clostridia bacterium]
MFTKEEIRRQLEALGVPRDRAVLVHTSLRAVGETEGRGEGFLDALIDHCTAEGGLLCIPTHTWAFGSREYPLDMTAPETCIGTLPNIAARDPRGVRTSHPSHSMAVFGDPARVAAFVAGEARAVSPCPPDGCYGKICEMDGSILLVGVGHNRDTYLHCVEEMMDVPNRLSPIRARQVRYADGRVEVRDHRGHRSEGIRDVSAHFPKYEPAFRHHGCIRDGLVGNAPTQLCSARGMRDVLYLVRERSGGIELLADDTPLEESYYK